MYEGRIYYDRIESDGRELSGYALRPAKALNEASWTRAKLVRPALLREDGSIEAVRSFGAAVHDGKLCILIERLGGGEALAELGLEGLGRALAALAAAYARGALDPADVDLGSLRRRGDAFLLLIGGEGPAASDPSRASKGSAPDSGGALAGLRGQRRAFASLIRGRLGLVPSGGIVPRARTDGRLMHPDLRSFLTGEAARSDAGYVSGPSAPRHGPIRRELSLWAGAARAVIGGAPYVEGGARGGAIARIRDALELRLSRAADWARRRRLGLGAAALMLALLAVIAGPMAWRRFGPPLSAGLSAEELAERYLSALAALDLQFIDSVRRPPAPLPYPQDLYALAAMSAVRRGMALSGGAGAQGSPDADGSPADLWEIVDASVARFELVGDGGASAELRYVLRVGDERRVRIDRLRLSSRGGHWFVSEHTELESTP